MPDPTTNMPLNLPSVAQRTANREQLIAVQIATIGLSLIIAPKHAFKMFTLFSLPAHVLHTEF